MTERSSPDPQPGLAGWIAEWLFPPGPPDGQVCPGLCKDHDHSGKAEMEAGS